MSTSSQNPSPESARERLIGYALVALPNEPAFAKCDELADAFRAEVLNEAADAIDAGKQPFPEVVRNGASWAARTVRRMANPDVTAAEMQRANGNPIGGA
ncbi:hypothetical protein GCM10011583_18610 [Streptomyces camponoticapitis]|uniref:Uncharacterized protein n=1 Tax=Streptomyces camponoticapitis TaxID=1616125 RepID=A0ABQ2E1V7_9ACTN|nr:hypothetical protein [Streptomyces camponoticapitis]GGJ87365.1 hypothetical protein GCM10011583_18610 [Streptomyces camponoticapitis]